MVNEIASKGQLRASFLRWAMVTVPAVLLLGLASGRVAPSGSDNGWYMALAKPAMTPPGWAFPVAWTTLYILMGLALAIVIHARGSRWRGPAIAAFAVQLALNLAWTPLFFGAHQVTNALYLLIAIFVAALATTVLFARVRKVAAWLLVPYLAWLSVAGVLNWRIDQMNPDAEALVPSASTTQVTL